MKNNPIYTGANLDSRSKSFQNGQLSAKASKRTVRARAKREVRGRSSRSPAKRQSLPTAFFVCAAFFGGVSFLAGGAWLSLQLIMSPDPVGWVNQYLPEETQVPTNMKREPPQTLAQIQAKLRQEGLIPSALVPIEQLGDRKSSSTNGQARLLWVTIETSPPKYLLCQSPCQQLSEIRIYQPAPPPHSGTAKETFFNLVSQMPVEGPPESSVIATLVKSDSQKQGSNRPQPLTDIEALQGEAPATGVWLNLTGYRLEGDTGIAYGQVLHYNPDSGHLSPMMQWSSVAGKIPGWQEVTGGDKPELVVNQTIGKEPRFEVYQIQPRNFLPNPIALEPVSLAQPALAIASYRGALQLAKSGLWSPAFKLLESIKQQRSESGEGWSELAQAQMDVIFLHAQATQKQANISWSEPGDRALADLIDGRWEEALKVFEADLDNTYKIAIMLKSDKGAIAKRVEAALKVNPQQPAVKAWGALLLAAQEGKERALSWLQQQDKNSSAPSERVGDLLARLDVAFSESTLVNHPGKIVGLATPLNAVKSADWLLPKPKEALQLENGQAWYQVKVAGFHDGQKWMRSPFSVLDLPRIEPGRRLWRILGLNINPKIQIGVWMSDGQQKLVEATVKAVSYQKGELQLLAGGEAISGVSSNDTLPRPIAFTADNFRWLEPESILLADLSLDQPDWVTAILTNLWRELQAADRLPAGAVFNAQEMLLQSSNLLVQSIDVNNNNLPDAVVTLQADTLAGWKKPGASGNEGSGTSSRPLTLIFDDTGELIYSEFTTDSGQFLTGFADMEDGGAIALMVENSNGYVLKRWVDSQRRFE